MLGSIERFQINELHGYKNFDLKFQDNTIILVGENGTGKTTVLRLLYYLLSSQWGSLAQYKFKSLIITINGKEHELPYSLIAKDIQKLDSHLLRRMPPPIRHRVLELLQQE